MDKGVEESSLEAKSIIIALDASYSMMAQDIHPNRYEFAKKTIEIFLENNPKTEITLIAFTQNPLLLSPPTTDHQIVNVALKTLNPNYILTKGTSLKNLFSKVATLKNSDKNLLLITDGGEEVNPAKLREQLHDAHINIAILAVGTIEGTTLKKEDGTLLKNREGDLVVSTLNPTLSELTENYIEADSTPKETAKGLEEVLQIEKKKRLKKLQHNHQELYQIPLFLALMLFFTLHTKFIKYLFIILSFLGISAQASILDNYHLSQAYKSYQAKEYKRVQKKLKKIENPSLESVLLLANSYYRLEAYDKAIGLYNSIRSPSIEIKQKIYYNIANAYVALKEYRHAKEYYTKALQLGEDEDSLYNLKRIIFKEEPSNKSALGISKPQSHNNQGAKSQKQQESKERNEKSSSSASGTSSSGADSKKKSTPKEEQKKLLLSSQKEEQQQPLSSKVYELINKGYIYETKPW